MRGDIIGCQEVCGVKGFTLRRAGATHAVTHHVGGDVGWVDGDGPRQILCVHVHGDMKRVHSPGGTFTKQHETTGHVRDRNYH